MATTYVPDGSEWRKFMITAGAALLVLSAVILVGAQDADGAPTAEAGDLTVTDVNRTVSGDVTDVSVTAELDYSFDVPDAERRIVKLKVGPDAGNLSTVAFRQDSSPGGADAGTVTLSGSVLDATNLTAAEVDPALASNTTTDLVVAATIEVRRAGGDPVTDTVTAPLSMTLRDGTDLTASVGGNVTVGVTTA